MCACTLLNSFSLPAFQQVRCISMSKITVARGFRLSTMQRYKGNKAGVWILKWPSLKFSGIL